MGFLVFSCSSDDGDIEEIPLISRVEKVKIFSTAIQNNMISESAFQKLVIYLPPSYYTTSKRYPVVFYLHGFGNSPDIIASYNDTYDQLMGNGTIKEMILVGINGINRLNGSFYVNSPVTGNWEDFVMIEVIQYIDTNYRTLNTRNSRGIAGFSMGGYSSINLAFKHPHVFSTVYSLCPGLFDQNGLNNAMVTWDYNFKNAYGAAFSPNITNAYPFCDIPLFNGTSQDNTVVSNWKSGFGNLIQKIKEYSEKSSSLSAIRIDYSANDYYGWISQGCVYFSNLLTSSNIVHTLSNLNIGHTINKDVIIDKLLPYFSESLQFE